MTPTLAQHHWSITWQTAEAKGPPTVVFFILKKRGGGPVALTVTSFSLMPIKFYHRTPESFCKGVTACPPVNEKSSPVQWFCVSEPPRPPPPTVLSITSTPIVCVVLTRQGINWVLLMPAFLKCAFWAERACVQFADSLPKRPLCSLTLRMCTLLRCECNL